MVKKGYFGWDRRGRLGGNDFVWQPILPPFPLPDGTHHSWWRFSICPIFVPWHTQSYARRRRREPRISAAWLVSLWISLS